MLYAHKNNLVHINEIEEDGRLLTTIGEIPVYKGDISITFINGITRLIDKQELDEYVQVERVKKPKFNKEQYEKMFMEFSDLELNSLEDQEYINGTRDLHKNDN